MIKINCGVTFEKGIQVVCDTIEEFEKFVGIEKERTHPVRCYIKEIKEEVVCVDTYNTGSYEWGVRVGENSIVPLCWKSLREYK